MLRLHAATRLFVIVCGVILIYAGAATIWAFISPAPPTTYRGYAYVIAALLVAAFTFLLGSPRSPVLRPAPRVFLLIALAVFVLTRVAWIALVPTAPVNDFLVLHNLAGTLSAGNPIPRIADRGNWPIFMYTWGYCLVLGGVYALFGKVVLVGQLFNVAMGATTLWASYTFTRLVATERIARGVAVLFLCWPAQIMFTNVIAAEHLALAAASIALLLVARVIHRRTSSSHVQYVSALTLVVAGTLLAVAYLSRFPLLVLLVAVVIALVVALGLTRRAAVAITLVVASFVAVNVGYRAVLRHVYQVNLPSRSMAGNLVVGINVDAGGGWNEPDWRTLISFPTMERASDWAIGESLRRIRERPLGILGLMVRKTAVYWRTDDYGVLWGVERSVPADRAAPYLARLYLASGLFHVAVMTLATCGAIVLMWRHARVGASLNLILLPLIGGTLLHSLLEVQSRYHFVFEPLLFVMTAIGAAVLSGHGSQALQSDHE